VVVICLVSSIGWEQEGRTPDSPSQPLLVGVSLFFEIWTSLGPRVDSVLARD
jgi:hypothetical protein